MYAYGTQQTNETIRTNIANSLSLHTVSNEQGEINRKAYEAEKVRKYKIRLIEGWRKAGRA